jgi:hypothetical protein
MPTPHALYSKMLAERTASRNLLVLFYLFYLFHRSKATALCDQVILLPGGDSGDDGGGGEVEPKFPKFWFLSLHRQNPKKLWEMAESQYLYGKIDSINDKLIIGGNYWSIYLFVSL